MSHNVTLADELAGRANIAAAISTIPAAGNVHTRRRQVNNRDDFVKKFGVDVAVVPRQKLIRYVDVEFVRWEDSPDEGFDDCPVLIGIYNFHVFHEFFDVDDNANSDRDFTGLLLDLRDKFLEVQEFAAGNFLIQTDGLTVPEFANVGQDGFTDATGHFIDIQLRANFYDAS